MKRLLVTVLIFVLTPSVVLATSRQLPVAYTSKTICAPGGGCDYSDTAAWNADAPADMVATTNGWVGKVRGVLTDDRVTISGSTSNQYYFKVLMADYDQQHNGKPYTGARMNYTVATGLASSTWIITMTESFSRVFDLEFTASINENYHEGAIYKAASYSRVGGCLFHHCNNASATHTFTGIRNNTGAGGTISNNIVHGTGGIDMGFYHPSADLTGNWFSNTVYDAKISGFCTTLTNVPVSNSISYGSDGGDWTSGTYCTGTWSQTTCADSGDTITFTDAANANLHITDGATGAVDLGTALVSPNEDDIDHQTRPQGAGWDIGADEYKSVNPAQRVIVVQ